MRRSRAPSVLKKGGFSPPPSIPNPCSNVESNKSWPMFKEKPENREVVCGTFDSAASIQDDGVLITYSVVYGKMSKKKHKIWEGDGTLVVEKKRITLKDENGKVLSQSIGVKPGSIEEGNQISIGSKDVEIISLLSNENINTNIPQPPLKPNNSEPIKKRSSYPPNISPAQQKRPKYEPFLLPRPGDEHQWHFNVDGPLRDVSVEPFLCRHLRPHQKEGVKFLYECVTGIRDIKYRGAILADEMGLGKTLQCIATIWTLLRQSPYRNSGFIKRVLVIAPKSLMQNWNNELLKWLGSHRIRTFVANKSVKGSALTGYHPNIPILIVSYEVFVKHSKDVSDVGFDLVVCDEGHRLKNSKLQAFKSLGCLKSKSRILLTGTPVQNDLKELFSLVDIVNPGLLGTAADFQTNFEQPILASKEPTATEDLQWKGDRKSKELKKLVSEFMLRRTQDVIGSYLPKKSEYVVFCALSQLQEKMYGKVAEMWSDRLSGNDLGCKVSHLALISALSKICNHPSLSNILQIDQEDKDEDESLLKLEGVHVEDSGKLKVLMNLLISTVKSKEKLVVVSRFTQTLKLIGGVCEEKGFKYLIFDGKTSEAERSAVVSKFNTMDSDVVVMLLSTKAGGVGLNLIGASRLVLFDSDWNPANDLQAMARIWRDGQKKNVHIYRLLSSGTVEEKIFQRQISKADLNDAVIDNPAGTSFKLSKKELKELLSFDSSELCLTHKAIKCECSGDGAIPIVENESINSEEERDSYISLSPQMFTNGIPRMNQLMHWEHHSRPLGEHLLSEMGLIEVSDDINFVFRTTVSIQT